MTTPSTAAGRALLDTLLADEREYASALVRISQIEAEARADQQRLDNLVLFRAGVETGVQYQAVIDTLNAQLLALREALLECVKHGNVRPFSQTARENALAVLTDTEAVGQEARERIEAPWREWVSGAWHWEGCAISERPLADRGGCTCGRTALLDKGGEK